MIQSVKVTNHLGESTTLKLRSPEKSGFLVSGINGLGPSKANINMTEVASMNGSVFNSSRVLSRNIVINLTFLPNPTIEDTRQMSYKYFPIQRRVELEIETDNRVCTTHGYIESNEPNIFSPQESTVISILCPDAYLYEKENSVTMFFTVTPQFVFPFVNNSFVTGLLPMGSIVNKVKENVLYKGDASVGVMIRLHFLGIVTGLVITNHNTNGSMTFNDARLVQLMSYGFGLDDDLYISTVKGDKYVILQRGGNYYNVLNILDSGYEWFSLERGNNIFGYTAVTGVTNIQFEVENKVAYEGA